MAIIDRLFGLGNKEEPKSEQPMENNDKDRIEGKIVKLDDGWGFIVSNDIPYTRIFFHWSALNQDTRHFSDLERGMRVEFEPKEYPPKEGSNRPQIRAIKIKVLD